LERSASSVDAGETGNPGDTALEPAPELAPEPALEPAPEPRVRETPRADLTPSQVMRNFETLERAPLLFTLLDPQLRRLARRLRPIELGPGVQVIAENQVSDSLYMIERGSCRVAVETQPEHLVTVGRLGDGDVFGETALIDEPSSVSVITLTDCRILAVDRTSLHAGLPKDGTAVRELKPLILRRQSAYQGMAERAGRVSRPGDAVITAVYGPKGGSGRTTIALNLAAQLARGEPGSVMLIDLDLPYTQAALLCGVVPGGSLTTASWRASVGTDADLEAALLGAAQLHPSGFMVLPAAIRIEESELVDPEHVTRALRVLRGSFRHLVVDLGIALNEMALGVFDLADYAIVVVTPELPSLKGTQDALRIIHDLMHFPDQGVKMVLNQRQANAVVPLETVERALGRAPDVVIGHDGNKPERAALAGTVLAATDPKSEITRGTRQLADLVSAPVAPAAAPQ
jgi:MinD-like ATPase involved in chromosome partitioning or flagellar assembly